LKVFAQVPISASDFGGNKKVVGEKFVFELNNKADFILKFKSILQIF